MGILVLLISAVLLAFLGNFNLNDSNRQDYLDSSDEIVQNEHILTLLKQANGVSDPWSDSDTTAVRSNRDESWASYLIYRCKDEADDCNVVT